MKIVIVIKQLHSFSLSSEGSCIIGSREAAQVSPELGLADVPADAAAPSSGFHISGQQKGSKGTPLFHCKSTYLDYSDW